jgi:hypothetical protein
VTTISTYLAASLVAVTFGWVPAERANQSQPSEGYDYLVKLSPEDLEALRDGRTVDLVSELPTNLGPIERVRILVGEGDAPQQLRERDRLSPQRIIASEVEAKRYKVAKPVTPEWGDAALLKTDDTEADDTPQRRTSYQNPTSLQQGFEQATRPLNEVGQVIDTQAKNLADGTAQFFQQGGDQIRRGAQDLLNGTGKTLENLVPTGSAAPYASRPQYDQPSLVTPPETSTAASAPQQAQFTSPSYPNQNYPQQNAPQQSYPANNQNNQSPNQFGSPPLANNYDQPTANNPSNSRLVESYASETDPYAATNRRVLQPVQRGDDGAAPSFSSSLPPASSSEQNPWSPFNGSTNSPSVSQGNPTQVAQNGIPAFPDLQSPANSGLSNNQSSGSLWSDNYSPPQTGQTGGGFASDRPGINPTPVSNTVNNGGTLGGSTTTGWEGRDFANSSTATNPNTTAVAQRADSSVVIDRLLMLILGGATCFTWIAYMDVRNKYLSVLRAAPGSGYSNAA